MTVKEILQQRKFVRETGAEARCGDAVEVLRGMEENSFDACLTDPPYGLEFMGKEWDHGVPGVATWIEVYRVLKPGAMLLAFGGTRTHHRLMCAIEDAGFEVRDCLMWLYGSGFPKSLDIGKALDKAAGAERTPTGVRVYADGTLGHWGVSDKYAQDSHTRSLVTGTAKLATAPATDAAKTWDGYGTALKPAFEIICLAMKPLDGSFAANALKWGVAGLNVDGGRIGAEERTYSGSGPHKIKLDNHGKGDTGIGMMDGHGKDLQFSATGRWPANLLLDEEAAAMLDGQSGITKDTTHTRGSGIGKGYHGSDADYVGVRGFNGGGGASRFFFVVKTDSLLYRAKAIMEVWNPDLASTADDLSSLSREYVASALSDVAILASQGETLLGGLTPDSMSATPLALRTLCENAIIAILSTGQKSWPASFRIDMARSNESPVKNADLRGQTGTMLITASLMSSGGFAVVATFDCTRNNSGVGGRDSPSRFRYTAKASRSERGEGNNHPTVKPLKLCEYLARLLLSPKRDTPRRLLVPFSGSGSEIIGALRAGWDQVVGIDNNPGYCELARRRIQSSVTSGSEPAPASPPRG